MSLQGVLDVTFRRSSLATNEWPECVLFVFTPRGRTLKAKIDARRPPLSSERRRWGAGTRASHRQQKESERSEFRRLRLPLSRVNGSDKALDRPQLLTLPVVRSADLAALPPPDLDSQTKTSSFSPAVNRRLASRAKPNSERNDRPCDVFDQQTHAPTPASIKLSEALVRSQCLFFG